MYKWSCSKTVSDTSQLWYLAGHTDSRMYIKIISAEPRYIHILVPLPLSHPGSEKRNRSIRTCAQDVQITHTVNNMINR
jgi:hypothetical protein